MRNKIIALMCDLYFEAPTARALLIGIGYRPSQIPEFRAAETFWPEVVLRLERGIVTNGVCRLVSTAVADYPANQDAATLLAALGCGNGRDRARGNGVPTVLCLFADPLRGSKIRIDHEARLLAEIEERGGIRFKIRFAVRVGDIVRLLAREKPRILHFGGHGSLDGRLVFESDSDINIDSDIDEPGSVSAASLARAIAATTVGPLDCVVLNSCYTGSNADAFGEVSNAVVGSVAALRDDDALAFAHGFYTAIANSLAVEKAFETGLAQIDLATQDRLGADARSGVHFAQGKRWQKS